MKTLDTKRIFWPVLILVVLFASSISLYIGLQQSVWFDEAYSVLLAKHSWTDIVRLTAQDVHPPVYYWVLKAWMMLFGSSDLALRSLSVLFFGLTIGVVGLLLRRLFGVKVALLALPFLVLAPFLLRYGFEIRMYALCSLIGVVATYVLVAAVEEEKIKRRRLLFLVYALLVALGVYTLYFMALVWIAHLAWLAYVAYTERRQDTMLYPIGSYAFALLLFLPWLPIFLSNASGGSLSPVTSNLGPERLYGVLTFLFLYLPPWEMMGAGILGIILIAAAVIYMVRQGFKTASKQERQYLALLGMYFAVPIIVLIVVTNIMPIYVERYNAHYAVGLYALVGASIALSLKKAKWFTRVASGAILMVLIFGSVNVAQAGNFNFQRLEKPVVNEVAGLLAECRDGATIYVGGPQMAMELMYYVTDCPVYFFNETAEMSGGFAMLSGSPRRVADGSELPESEKILHVYYDSSKRSVPSQFEDISTVTVGKVYITTYQAGTR